MAQYKRILLKLSGESLMGGKQYGIDEVRLNEYAAQIKEIAEMGGKTADRERDADRHCHRRR